MSKDRVIFVRHVPADLHRQLRLKAAEEDRSVNDLALDALENYLAQAPVVKPVKR